MDRFAGQTVLITGGGSGIGAGCAYAFAAERARVAVVDRDGPAAAATATAIRERGGEALALVGDVSDPTAVEGAVTAVCDTWQRIDVLINSAGHSPLWAPLHECTDTAFEALVAVHLRGTFLVTRAVLPTMLAQQYGRIVNISSVNYRGKGNNPIYAAVKAAQYALANSIALEYGPAGITANTIAPGLTDTPLTRHPTDEHDPQRRTELMSAGFEAVRTRTRGVQRVGTVADQANAVMFFADPASSYVTGQIVDVAGTCWM